MEVMKMNAIELKVERTRKGFTQEHMANIIGVSTVSYSKKERGEVRFKPEEIILVAEALELDQDRANAIFFDGKLPKGNSRAEELPKGNEADSAAPCT